MLTFSKLHPKLTASNMPGQVGTPGASQTTLPARAPAGRGKATQQASTLVSVSSSSSQEQQRVEAVYRPPRHHSASLPLVLSVMVGGSAEAAEASGRVTLEVPSIATASLLLGGLAGGAIFGVILTTRLVENVLKEDAGGQPVDPKRALSDVLSSLREAAPVVGLIITLVGGFLGINSRVESLELKLDAQNTRIDAQNTRIDAQNTRIDALNVRAESELRTLAEQTAALRGFNEQIFRLALRQAQEQNVPLSSPPSKPQ